LTKKIRVGYSGDAVCGKMTRASMKDSGLKPLPENILKIHESYHRRGISEADCVSCSSVCCSRGGFALLENIVLIYERYKKRLIKREDFNFEAGLSFKRFVVKYFDIYSFQTGRIFRRKSLLLFHTRVLTEDKRLISIPAVVGKYSGSRMEEETRPEKEARGCIFLSKKSPNWPEDDGDISRKCLLHSEHFATHITEKPLDCVFFTCTSPLQPKATENRVAKAWIESLAKAFPDSMEKFAELVGEFVIDNLEDRQPGSRASKGMPPDI